MKRNTEMLCEGVKRSKDPSNELNIMTESQNIATEMLTALTSQELLSTLEENDYWETVVINLIPWTRDRVSK